MLDIINIRDSANFPIVDFKFINRGHGAAFLKAFSISVLSYSLDLSPVVRPFLLFIGDGKGHTTDYGSLNIALRNDGWGPAYNLCMKLTSPLSDLFPEKLMSDNFFIESGGTLMNALVLTTKHLDSERFLYYLQSKRYDKLNQEEFDEIIDSIQIEKCDLEVSFLDIISKEHIKNLSANKLFIGNVFFN